jgi:hypothetical protein
MFTICLLLQRTESIIYKTNGTTCIYEFKFTILKKELNTFYCNNGNIDNLLPSKGQVKNHHKLGLDILNIIIMMNITFLDLAK